MIKTFAEFVEHKSRLLGESEDDPVARWMAMRSQTQGLGDGPEVGTYRPDAASQGATHGAPQDTGIPNQILDIITSGFQTGGIVPDQVVRILKLDGANYSLVGDSSMVANSRGPYPFVKEKRAGVQTGKIRFVQGYSVSRFLSMIKDLQQDQSSYRSRRV